MDDERERRMAFKMISTIDQMKASADNKDRIKQLYVHSDELAWLGEHFNRENDDTEMLAVDSCEALLREIIPQPWKSFHRHQAKSSSASHTTGSNAP